MSLIKSLIDYLFPIFCVGCKREGMHLCSNCLNSIPREEKFYDGIFSAARFEEHSTLARLIHRFKYEFAKDVGKILAEIGTRKCPLENAVLCSVPLHWFRKRSRGFNQSEILALELSHKWSVPYANLLKRHEYTYPQMKLAREKRLRNLKSAFSINHAEPLDAERAILVIDDVSSTGATLHECIKVLRSHGAKSVYGFVIAQNL